VTQLLLCFGDAGGGAAPAHARSPEVFWNHRSGVRFVLRAVLVCV